MQLFANQSWSIFPSARGRFEGSLYRLYQCMNNPTSVVLGLLRVYFR